MIKSFADKDTERVFSGRPVRKLGVELQRRAARKLQLLDQAEKVSDLSVPPGNRLHKLGGDRSGQWTIAVSEQFRICFYFDHEAGDAHGVEITDYH